MMSGMEGKMNTAKISKIYSYNIFWMKVYPIYLGLFEIQSVKIYKLMI